MLHRTHASARGFNNLVLGFLMVLILVLGSGTFAQDMESEATPEITLTETPTSEASPSLLPTLEEAVPSSTPVFPEVTNSPTSEPTAEATEEVILPTSEATEAAPVTDATAEIQMTAEAAPIAALSVVNPLAVQTYCQFDIGNGGDNNPLTYTFSATSANIATWDWNFGDSTTGSGQTVNHTYSGPGTYPITLVCTPATGFGSPMTLTGSVQISLPAPVAYFTVNQGTIFEQIVNGANPLHITTSNLSTPAGLDYQWSMPGSGVTCASLTTENLDCTITDYGSFTFGLTATNSSGSSTFSQTIGVNAPVPQADFSLTPSSGTAPLTVTFAGIMDAASGPITTWEWDFDDDGMVDATGQNPAAYTYTTAGLYGATLTVTGPGGMMEIARSVNVFESGNSVQAAFTMEQTGAGATPGMVQVCFTNTSTGPIQSYAWDFGDDGTTDEAISDPYFCRDFPPGLLEVRLRVTGATPDVTSQAFRQLSLVAAPVAAFTYSPTSGLNQSTQIDFDSGTSTGIITSYAWDFDGDGITDSTAANPQDILLAIGSNRVRLTVTGPGGSSSVEQIINVARLEITCSINGNFAPLPGSNNQTYTSTIGNIVGRTVTYAWEITGGAVPASGTGDSFPVTLLAGTNSYQITLTASTPDGSLCSDTRTITTTYPPLVCNMNNPLPGTLYPNGQNYTFGANVSGLSGRTITSYQWSVDGIASGSGSSLLWTNPAPSTGNHTIRYVATASDGSSCFEEVTAVVTAYPTPTCTGISGDANPIPVNGSGSPRDRSYTANVTGLAGRTASYTWTVQGATSATSSNPSNVRWPLSYASNPPGTSTNIGVAIVVQTPGEPDTILNCARTVNVTINNLVCAAPTGDLTPVVGETNTYNYSVSNLYGRTPSLAWELRQGATVVASGTGSTFSYQFLQPGEVYTLHYTASVNTPQPNSCNASATLTVTGADQSFACDVFPTNGNNFTPAAAGSYSYTVDMDNGNALQLLYRYVLVGPNGGERLLGSTVSGANGLVPGPVFSLNELGPIGIYTLRVDVQAVDPAVTPYTCSLSHALTVGSLNVSFDYDNGSGGAVNPSAVEVGKSVCFTNTSAPVPPVPSDQNALTYTWDVNGTSNAGLPGCITFDTPGTYTVNLTGENFDQGDASFHREQTASVVFNVYGSQSITITRSNQVYAPAAMNFTANGTNITGGYNWAFYSGATLLGTRSNQQNPSFNFPTPGTYRAVVTGTGPLGATSAEVEFTLISTNDVLASFIPTQYAGIAPMRVCFADTSQGQNLTEWEWDFGNGETLNYTATSIPSQICTDYPTPNTSHPVTLVVRNQSGTSATATNIIRTYSLLESRITYHITPQGGGRYCFTADISPGVTVTGWDFGDTTTGGPQNTICHQFQSTGDYRVQMSVEGPGGEPGAVERVVTVNLTGGSPSLSASAVCAANRTATFTVENSGDAMTTADQIVVRNANGDVIDIRPVQLGSGAQMSFSLDNQSGPLTLTLTDASSVTATTTCNYPPELSASATCAGGLPVFTITNARPGDGPMISPQAYEIRDGSGTLVSSGTFELGSGVSSEIITLPAGVPVYAVYTLNSSGAASTFQISHSCDAPQVTVAAVCSAGLPVFTVTNPTPGNPMAAPQAYEIHDANGAVVSSGTFELGAGISSEDISLPASATPYAAYTFVSDGAVGTFRVSYACDAPVVSVEADEPMIVVTGTCAAPAAFTISNRGGAMAAAQNYTLVSGGRDVTPANDAFLLAAGETTQIFIPADASTLSGVTFRTAGAAAVTSTLRCQTAVSQSATAAPTEFRFTGLPLVENAPLCAYGCPTFQLYHTDEMGDWEIFRLDSADALTRTTIRENLSLGMGEGVVDMAPSLSPGNNWIVFQSNRDGNWELYVAPTSGGDPDAVQRLTYNRIAIDGDPMWGPNNFVVFESTRNGNYDLFLIDMSTGQEYQLTDSEGDDINPYWSPDGTRVLFQSDRGTANRWQLYELNIATGQLAALSASDVVEVDPQYSHDGSQIVFRSYANDGDVSTLMVMNRDGSNHRPISDPNGDATNAAWSPSDRYLAYQSDVDGDLDIYIYDLATGATRQLTDNAISDYAPTWRCTDERVVFTSDITGDPNIFEADVSPLDAPAIAVDEDASQMTFELSNDIYPHSNPSEENASREGQTLLGAFGEQTVFLQPPANVTQVDLSLDGLQRDEWKPVLVCSANR